MPPEYRSTNVGAEHIAKAEIGDSATGVIMKAMCSVGDLSTRHAGMVRLYVRDMRAVLSEINRVLCPGGKAILVVGNCNLRETFIANSECIRGLAGELDMIVGKVRSRRLPDNRRYLPPPQSLRAGAALKMRMREEVIMTLLKRN